MDALVDVTLQKRSTRDVLATASGKRRTGYRLYADGCERERILLRSTPLRASRAEAWPYKACCSVGSTIEPGEDSYHNGKYDNKVEGGGEPS